MSDDNEKVFLDEGRNVLLGPSKEMKEHMKKIWIASNQHLLNDDKTGLKPSANIKQSLRIFNLNKRRVYRNG